MDQELNPLVAKMIYGDDGALNEYGQTMQAQFPDAKVEDFAALRFAMENEAPALMGAMENHFGPYQFSKMETAAQKYMAAGEPVLGDLQGPVAPSPVESVSTEEAPEYQWADSATAAAVEETNTDRFLAKAADMAQDVPLAIAKGTWNMGVNAVTQPVRTVTGTGETLGRMASGAVDTVADTPDVLEYGWNRLMGGANNLVARAVGAVGSEGDARNKGWERIFAWQRAIDAIPGPALGFAATPIRLGANSEEDLEFYREIGVHVPKGAKVGDSWRTDVNIKDLDKIAERLGSTSEQLTIDFYEGGVAKSLNELDTVAGAFVGDMMAFTALTLSTGGGNVMYRIAQDAAIEAGSATDSDPGFSEAMLQMAGLEKDQIPELIQVQGKQDIPSMLVRAAEGAAMSGTMEMFFGTISKLKRGDFPNQEVAVATIKETHEAVQETMGGIARNLEEGARVGDELVEKFNAAKATEIEFTAQAPATLPEFPSSLKGSKPKYRNMHLEFDDDITRALYVVGGNGKSKSHDAFLGYLKETLGEGDWEAVGTAMRQAMKDGYEDGGVFRVTLPEEARTAIGKGKDVTIKHRLTSPEALDINSSLQEIAEDIALGKSLDGLDPKAVDAATSVRDFENYLFLDGTGRTTAALREHLDGVLKESTSDTMRGFVNKAKLALDDLRAQYPDEGALPKWALEEINTGSEAVDKFAKILSIKATNSQIDRLSQFILSGGKNTDILEGMDYIAKASDPVKVANGYLQILLENATDLNGQYIKMKREWGQFGAILKGLKRGVEDATAMADIDNIIKREIGEGYLDPAEVTQRVEHLKDLNAKRLNPYANATEGNFWDTVAKNQYGNLLINTATLMVNLTSEFKRTVGIGTIAPVANSIELLKKGRLGKAAIELGRLPGQVLLAPKQIGKVIENVRTVWKTGMGEMTRELTPYMASSNRQLTLGEVFGARHARDTFLGKAAIVPARTIDVTSQVAVRLMGTISEAIGTAFHGANVDYSTLTGKFGKKWRDLYLKQGGLSTSQITEMLTEAAEDGGTMVRRTVTDNVIEERYASISQASRLQDKTKGTWVGAMEAAMANWTANAAVVKWMFPFFGVGVRIAEETLTAAVPGLAYARMGGRGTMAWKRMNHPDRWVRNAWRYYYGAMQVNMMMSMAQGLKDYTDLEDGVPPLPEAVGDSTTYLEPVAGKFGQFGGGIVELEMLPDGTVQRTEKKSMELMDSSTVSFLWRNLGYNIAMMWDETDTVETMEAFERLASSQINSVMGASIARTLPQEFSKLTGQQGGQGVFDWLIVGKLGAQVPLASGYRNMKKLFKEQLGDPAFLKANFKENAFAYTAERASWVGDLAKVAWPSMYRAMNKDLTVGGYAVQKGKRGSLDPNTKTSQRPKSVVVFEWLAGQQNRKMINEEFKFPGTDVMLREVMGGSGYSLFTEVMERSNQVALPHPDNASLMVTMTDYMDEQLDNPTSALRIALSERGYTADTMTQITNGDVVAALDGGDVLWDFFVNTQKRYNDVVLAQIISELSDENRELLLQSVDEKNPEFWIEKFSPQAKAQLGLLSDGEATYSEGDFTIYK